MCDNLGDHLVGNVYIKVSKMRISYAIVGVFCFSFQMKRQQRRLFRISTIAGLTDSQFTPSYLLLPTSERRAVDSMIMG